MKQFINKGIKIFLEELKDLEDNYLEQYSSLKKSYYTGEYIKEYNYTLLVEDAFKESILQLTEETSLDFFQREFFEEVKRVMNEVRVNSMEEVALIVCYNIFNHIIDIQKYNGILTKYRVDLKKFNRKIMKDLYKIGVFN